MDSWIAADQSKLVEQSPPRRQQFRIPTSLTHGGVIASEATIVLLASVGGRVAFSATSGRAVGLDTAVGVGLFAAVLFVSTGQVLKLHEFSQLLVPDLRRVAFAGIAVMLLLTADLFALKAGADVSRGYLLTFGGFLLCGTAAVRVVLGQLLTGLVAANLVSGRRAVLIGTPDELSLLHSGDLFRMFGLSEVARVTIADPEEGSSTVLDRAASEAVRVARTQQAEELVVAAPWSRFADQMRPVETGLRLSPLPVRLLPDASARNLLARHGSGRGFALIDLQRAPMGLLDRATKRVMDMIVAVVALTLLFPLLLFVAFAVRLDSQGPVLFRQRRNGFDQRSFMIYKFRTMTVMEDHGAMAQARRGDHRVTRVGRMLRRTSIDELPQLFNVLRGEMAIVGPRPHALAHDRFYSAEIDDYCVRHHVKPGITGWAQVNGLRGETSDPGRMAKRVAHDLWYINNWSLILDLRILLRTCREVLAHDAY